MCTIFHDDEDEEVTPKKLKKLLLKPNAKKITKPESKTSSEAQGGEISEKK